MVTDQTSACSARHRMPLAHEMATHAANRGALHTASRVGLATDREHCRCRGKSEDSEFVFHFCSLVE
jgi:hypothetical protein